MITLTQKPPTSVFVDDTEYEVAYDFRSILGIVDALESATSGEEIKGLAAIQTFYKGNLPTNIQEALQQWGWFFRCGRDALKAKGGKAGKTKPPDMSFSFDAPYIYAAFLEQYGIDLTEADLHWWKFMALFKSLSPDCKFNEIRHCRSVSIKKNTPKERQDYYKEMKRIHALPNPEQDGVDALTDALLHGGDVSGLL